MSTKIYDGHCCKNISFVEFYSKFVSVKNESIYPYLKKLFLKEYYRHMSFLHDLQLLKGVITHKDLVDFFSLDSYQVVLKHSLMKGVEENQEVRLYRVVDNMFDYYYDKSKSTHCMFFDNLNFQISFAPIKDNFTLIKPFYNQEAFQILKNEIPEIELYDYYNNSDCYEDEGISQEEWDERGKVWLEALGKGGVFAENFLTYDIRKEIYTFAINYLEDKEIDYINRKFITSDEDRIKKLTNYLFEEYISDLTIKEMEKAKSLEELKDDNRIDRMINLRKSIKSRKESILKEAKFRAEVETLVKTNKLSYQYLNKFDLIINTTKEKKESK